MGIQRPSAFLFAGALLAAIALVAGFAVRVGSGTLPTADITLDVDAVQDGRIITYTVHFDNVGAASAPRVILRDILPEGGTYLGDPDFVRDGVWTKEYEDLAPGPYAETIAIELPASVRDGDPVVNYVEVRYVALGDWVTKAYWHEIDVEIPAPDQAFPALVVAAPIAGGAAIAAFVAYRPRRRPHLEQVFLMHNSGMLIHHWAANTSPSRDIDILSGMFVILKEFVRDSFREKAGGLTELQFGDSRVFLAEGRHAILAAVASGKHVNGLPMQIAAAVEEFEARHGTVLPGWSGQLDLLPDAKSVVERLVRGEYGHRRVAA